MLYSTLVSSETLFTHLDDWVVIDCRFSLDDPGRGRVDYLKAHIPGAVYAHLDEDLSGKVIPGETGRHPLPRIEQLVERFSSWGIGDGVQVAAYDDAGGGMAARLWWLLRYLGNDAAAVLDGGYPDWLRRGFPTRAGSETRERREFMPRVHEDWVLDADAVDAVRGDPSHRLLDARDAERFRGEVEPIDPVAGHIPGALSAPFKQNLTPEGRFRSPEELRDLYGGILGEIPSNRTVCYCGSGVTAAHDILAIAHAGLDIPKLYAGSWSEWITKRGRPVERGDVGDVGT